jgi:Rrf2 family protein
MKLSKRGEYALRALINLGLAEELGRGMLQIRELAEQENMPVKFLEQILVQLKEAGYLDSRRGKLGGYFLGKPMGRITIGEVVRLIDGPLAPIPCASKTAYRSCSCPDENHCGLRILMLDVRNAIAGILDRHTVADVVGVTLRKLRRDGAPLPSWDGARFRKGAARRARLSGRREGGEAAAARCGRPEGPSRKALRRRRYGR